ncbi:sphinganine C4-monooxygenase 1-like protein, partial [Tanacetum coccineum]
KGPINIFTSSLGGWERDQFEVGDIFDKYGLKSLYAFNKSEKTRGVPIRFNLKNGGSLLTYKDGSVVCVDGEPKGRGMICLHLTSPYPASGVIGIVVVDLGMTARTAVMFFCFATVKTVDDHCGLWLQGILFHMLFQNNTAYHDVHHQLHGLKYYFSQPFFSIWDKLLGTYMPYDLVKRAEGGFEARLSKKTKSSLFTTPL